MSWVHAVVDAPAGERDDVAAFWGRVLGWPVGEPWEGHPELASFEPPTGTPYLHLQRIDGPAGLHLDVESENPDQTVALAVDLGAEPVRVTDRWHTLRSPGGLPFCVLRTAEHEPPDPVAFWLALLPGRGWHVLGDVIGRRFCVTGNSPEETLHRDLG